MFPRWTHKFFWSVLVLLLGQPDARAQFQWATDGIPLALATTTQVHLSGIPDGNGGIFIAWEDNPAGDSDIYAHDSESIAHDVAQWAIKHGDDPKYRIVLAGFEGEHGSIFEDHGWQTEEWFNGGFLRGGMGNIGKGGHQQNRERLYLSPHCLSVSTKQTDLFGG